MALVSSGEVTRVSIGYAHIVRGRGITGRLKARSGSRCQYFVACVGRSSLRSSHCVQHQHDAGREYPHGKCYVQSLVNTHAVFSVIRS